MFIADTSAETVVWLPRTGNVGLCLITKRNRAERTNEGEKKNVKQENKIEN